MRVAHSSPPCIARFFTAGFSPLFTRPKAVEKLDFEIEHSARKLAVQQIGVYLPIPKASALVFTMRAAHSSPPCIARFFTAGFSPLFTRPKAVEKLDFEFWILDIQVRRHVPQGGVLGGRINEKPPGEAKDGSLA